MPEIIPYEKKFGSIKTALEDPKMKARLGAALPAAGITPQRFIQTAFTTIQRQPKLVECDLASLLGCFIMSAQSGLDPSGVTGEAYLVPYGKTATFIPGYRGLMKMGYRSGEVASINAEIVRQGDDFEYSLGLDPKIAHRPIGEVADDAKTRWKNITHAYCIAKLKSGGTVFKVMTKAEICAIRGRSKAADSGPWVTDPEAMAIKTAVRATMKFVPLSASDMRLVVAAEQEEAGLPQDFSDLMGDDVKPADATVRSSSDFPDPNSPEGKKLAAELDRANAQ